MVTVYIRITVCEGDSVEIMLRLVREVLYLFVVL